MNSVFLLVAMMLLTLLITQSKADLVAQAKIAAQKSIVAARGTSQIAKKYAKGSTKGAALTCIESCGDAVDNLNRCLGALKTYNPGKKADLQTWASAAETDVGTCDDAFDESGAGEPADVKRATQSTSKIISTLLTIINHL